MIIELGHFVLILAFAVSIVQAIIPLIGAAKDNRPLMQVGTHAATIQFLLIALSFAMLTVAFVTNPVAISSLIWVWLLAVGVAGGAIYGSFQLSEVPPARLWTVWGMAFAMGLVGWILILRSAF